MSTRQFIDLEGLDLYDSLLKNYVAAEDAKAIKCAIIEGYQLKFYTVENPTAQDTPKYNITLPQPDLSNFVERVIEGSNGKALVFNESDGGGSKFEHKDGTWSFTGVNDGGANGLAAQIYAVNKDTKVGTRINVTTQGIYYTNGNSNASYVAGDEIATKKDIKGDANAKTVYVVETAGGSGDAFSKKYDFYQGANGSSADPDPSEKLTTIAIAKDMFVESGSVGTVTVADEPYPGAKVGDKYIDIVLANSASQHIYIPANSLVDIYRGSTNAEMQISIDGTNTISATVVEISGSKLTDASVTRAKLAGDVTSSLDLADTALQNEDIGSVPEQDIRDLFTV